MEPNAFFASPSLSGEVGILGSGMSPMNLRIITQMSMEAWGGEESVSIVAYIHVHVAITMSIIVY